MATLTEVIRHQRSERGGNKGSMGSLATAIGQKTKQAIDPRNHLFSDDGFMATLFSGLKGYKAKGQQYRKKPTYNRENNSENVSRVDINRSLNKISGQMNTVVKNTSYLRQMATDIKLLKRGLLSKDSFKGAEDKENALESKNPDSTAPSKVEDKRLGDGGGFLDTIVKVLGYGAIIGAVITGITKYFTDDEFKTKMQEMINAFSTAVFGEEKWKGIKETITGGFKSVTDGIAEVWENHWGKIVLGLGAIGALMNPIGTLAGLIGIAGKAGSLIGGITTLIGLISGPVGLAAVIAGIVGYGAYDSIKNPNPNNLPGDVGYSQDTVSTVDQKKIDEQRYKDIKSGEALNVKPGEVESIIQRLKDDPEKTKLDEIKIRRLEKEKNGIPVTGKSEQSFDLNQFQSPTASNTPQRLSTEEYNKGGAGFASTGMINPNVGDAFSLTPTPLTKEQEGILKKPNNKVDHATKFFESKGWSKEQAAGIVGNLLEESGLDPTKVNKSENAQGIAQWRKSRIADFEQKVGKKVTSASLDEQLAFIDFELNGKEKKAGDSLRKTKTIEEATRAFDKDYERSALGAKGLTAQSRINNAKGAFSGDSPFNKDTSSMIASSSGNPSKIPMKTSDSNDSSTPGSMLSSILAASGKMLSPEMMKKMPGMLQEKLKGMDYEKALYGGVLNGGSIEMNDLNKKQSKIQPQQNLQVSQGASKSPIVNQSSGSTEVFDIDIYKLITLTA